MVDGNVVSQRQVYCWCNEKPGLLKGFRAFSVLRVQAVTICGATP